jgi:rhamnulose-1-phosphate aldolase
MKTLMKNKNFVQLAGEMADVAGILWRNGWAERNAGNISVDVSGMISLRKDPLKEGRVVRLEEAVPGLAERMYLISAAGTRMRDLAVKPFENTVLVRIQPDGASFSVLQFKKKKEKKLVPTSELSTHLGIHQMIVARGSDEKVVLHTHATELITLTHSPEVKTKEALNRILWGMHPETIMFVPKGFGLVPYIHSGSAQIAISTVEALQKHDVVVWEKHGVFAIGKTLHDTFDRIDIACKSARIWFLCKSAGFEPEGLSREQLLSLEGILPDA